MLIELKAKNNYGLVILELNQNHQYPDYYQQVLMELQEHPKFREKMPENLTELPPKSIPLKKVSGFSITPLGAYPPDVTPKGVGGGVI